MTNRQGRRRRHKRHKRRADLVRALRNWLAAARDGWVLPGSPAYEDMVRTIKRRGL